MNIENELDGNVCPPTFYKNIKYTYDGKNVEVDSIKSVFEKLLK